MILSFQNKQIEHSFQHLIFELDNPDRYIQFLFVDHGIVGRMIFRDDFDVSEISCRYDES
jgi:hypothetical protein